MSDPQDKATPKLDRRAVLGATVSGAVLAAGAPLSSAVAAGPPLRTLGKTGVQVQPVSLGGEGILRTVGRSKEAVPVILEALKLGVRYCDTAPAYSQSQDYYGEAFKSAGKKARDGVFLASKTHARDRDGALRLLDDSLKRLGTDRLDLWQLHDLRTEDDLRRIFGKGGAIEAVAQAKSEGRIRFVGITGHHDPAILIKAMAAYELDTVLAALNPADPRRLPFAAVIAEARKRNMGVIGMKVMAHGQLLLDKAAEPAELIRYAASTADTVIIGCSTVEEVRQNLAIGAAFVEMPPKDRSGLEARIAPQAARYDSFKRA